MTRDEDSLPPAGWAWDPSKRHRYRYWDGSCWTSQVADDANNLGTDTTLPRGTPAETSAAPGVSNVDDTTIDGFFADPKRQGSRDVKFGERWRSRDDPSAEYHLYWLEGTRECYLMRSPFSLGSDPLETGTWLDIIPVAIELVTHRQERRNNQELRVEVLARGISLQEAQDRLHGWEAAMDETDSVNWARDRLTQ